MSVSGLDVTIGSTILAKKGDHPIAALPVIFINSIVGAAIGPFMPTTSALTIQRMPAEMGNLFPRMTRYITILMIVGVLPLLVGSGTAE